jgi:O-methyltransferase
MARLMFSRDQTSLRNAAVLALLAVLIVRSLVITGSGANCRGGETVSVIESKVCTSTVKVVPLHPVKEAPFPEMKGERYHIFHPATTTATNQVNLLGAPETWIEQLTRRYKWLDERTMGYVGTPEERSVSTYLEMVRKHVSGIVFGDMEKSIPAALASGKFPLSSFSKESRELGQDWAYLGVTMTGFKRLDNVENLIRSVVQNNIEGDYIETGVWRGGSSIFARAVWRSLNQGHRRSFVCDSFRGLPPGDRDLDAGDKNWDDVQYLEVSSEEVGTNFWEAGVVDLNVVFVKGFFNDTMPPLAPKVDKLSIMRLDGDMYESTVDVLYHLYGKLSIGGYVIMDDWFGFPSKTACEDFFSVHNMKVDIIPIDNLSAYWQKTEEVDIQFWRYEKNQFVGK